MDLHVVDAPRVELHRIDECGIRGIRYVPHFHPVVIERSHVRVIPTVDALEHPHIARVITGNRPPPDRGEPSGSISPGDLHERSAARLFADQRRNAVPARFFCDEHALAAFGLDLSARTRHAPLGINASHRVSVRVRRLHAESNHVSRSGSGGVGYHPIVAGGIVDHANLDGFGDGAC